MIVDILYTTLGTQRSPGFSKLLPPFTPPLVVIYDFSYFSLKN